MTCVEPQRMRMTRSFSHYTDGAWVYLTIFLKLFFERCVVWSDAFASRLAPTGDRISKCGSEPAREEAGNVSAK
jgi:hypothetical protein